MNIFDIAISEGINFDRYVSQDLSLPYSFEEIKIQANETVSSDLINIKLKYLFDNFMHLYKNTLISSNVIPVSCTGIAGITGSSNLFTWYFNISSRQFTRLSQNSKMIGADDTKSLLLIKNSDLDRYSLLASNGLEVRVINFDTKPSFLEVVFTQSEVDANYGVAYKNVCDMEVNKNYVYFLDNGLNQIIKYDASGLTSFNIVTNNRLLFANSIGNTGDFLAKTAFNNPRALAFCNDMLLVLDSGNSSVKIFDENLNWKFTYRLYKDFLSAFPIDIACDSNSNVYILTENKKIYRYNFKFNEREVFDLTPILQESEIVKKIEPSKSDKNFFYLITNKNVFKKLFSSPDSTVGKYLLYLFKYDIPDETINGFSTAPTTDGKSDRNIMFSVSGNVGKFGNFFDNKNLYDILSINNFDVYDFNEIKFNRSEYIQSWVFNKAISKFLINHMRLRDQIIGKFLASLDYKGNLLFYGTRYLLPNELDQIFFDQDITFYIGSNEIFTNSSVNRALEKIYKIQENLFNVLKEEIRRIPFSTAPIILN